MAHRLSMSDFDRSTLHIRVEALLRRDVPQSSCEPPVAAKRVLECTHEHLNSKLRLAQLVSDLRELGYGVGNLAIQDLEWHYSAWWACVSCFPLRCLPHLASELPKLLVSRSLAAFLAHMHMRRQAEPHVWEPFLNLAAGLESDWAKYVRTVAWAPLQKNGHVCALVGAAMRVLADLGKRISVGLFNLDSSQTDEVVRVCRQYRKFTSLDAAFLEDPRAILTRVSSGAVRLGRHGLCSIEASLQRRAVLPPDVANVNKMLTCAYNWDALLTDSERYHISGVAFDVIQSIATLESPSDDSRMCCSFATVCCNIIEVQAKDNSLMVVAASIYLCRFLYRMSPEYHGYAAWLWLKRVRPHLHAAYPWFMRDRKCFYKEVCEACSRNGDPDLFDESDYQLGVVKDVCRDQPWFEMQLQVVARAQRSGRVSNNTSGIRLVLAFFDLLGEWAHRKQLSGEMPLGQGSVCDRSGKRIALLIGQGCYPEASGFSRLNAAHNDVDGMAHALETVCGFYSVLRYKDVGRAIFEIFSATMLQLIAGDPESFVLFYYAGHGFKLSDTTLLVPIDAINGKAETYVNLDDVLRPLHDAISQRNTRLANRIASEHSARHAPGTQVFVMLDACREWLCESTFASSASCQSLTSTSSRRARTCPKDSQFAYLYACDAGETAREDGSTNHGYLTEAFLHCLNMPNLTLHELEERSMERCNGRVRGNCQRPWYLSCLHNGRTVVLNRRRLIPEGN